MIKLITDPNKPLPHFRDVDAFMAHFGVRARGACACTYLQMDQPAAAHRVKVGVPATVEHAAGDGAKPGSAERTRLVAETTQNFITLMDALKLKLRAKDQLHPLFGDLLASYTKVGAEVGEARAKLLHWCVGGCRACADNRLITLNQMSASEEVDEQAAREVRSMRMCGLLITDAV